MSTLPTTRTTTIGLLALIALLSGCTQIPATDAGTGSNGATTVAPARLPHRPPRAPGGTHEDKHAGQDDGEDDGAGTLSPFETGNDEISNLDPDLLAAVQEAAREAKQDHVPFWVTSGWRSRAHQQRLLDDAVARYGSLAQALRWVSTPDTSAHVQGHAVDIGPGAADAWLEHNGVRWGLCRAFANERWHFELRAQPGGTCPSLYPDSSYRQ